MGNSLIVAIDGPAGAGKGTVAKAAAARLGLTYLDTGAMYRCVALAHLRNPATDPAELARSTEIQLGSGCCSTVRA
jgi:cytidylate kinase